jgi:hypothetical protein
MHVFSGKRQSVLGAMPSKVALSCTCAHRGYNRIELIKNEFWNHSVDTPAKEKQDI